MRRFSGVVDVQRKEFLKPFKNYFEKSTFKNYQNLFPPSG